MNILDYIKGIFSSNKKTATFYATSLKKKYNEKEALEFALYDDKTPIRNTEVGIEINNKPYIKTTDENGVARLNINLGVGQYTAKLYFPGSDVYNKTTAYAEVIISTDTYMDGINLTKTVGDSTPYQCAVYRVDNNQRVKDEVTFNINGKSYTRKAEDDGLYKLNINLNQGTYNIEAKYNGNQYFNPSSINNTITINAKPPEPVPEPTPEKSYSQEILEYFESKFGEMDCIDDCLEAIQGNGYGYYYDDQYSNYTSINRMANGSGVNCTDSCQVFWHLAVALGYRVEVLHIQCSGGDGHVRLELEREGTGTFYRDPAACLDGNSIDYNWCTSGFLISTNPDWFFQNLYK